MGQGKGGGGPIDNQKAVKLTTDELKQEAYRQYCAHLAAGKSKRSWVFKHPDMTLTAAGFENYLKNEAVFDPLQKQVAEAEGYGMWEDIVCESAKGKNTKANTASLQMVMRNKYGWDKLNLNTHTDESAAIAENNKILDKLVSHIDSVHVDATKKNNIQIDLKMSDNNDTTR